MATWNTNPSVYSDKLGPVVTTASAIRSVGVYAGVAVASAALSQYGEAMWRMLHLPHIGTLGLLLVCVALVSALGAVRALGRLRTSRKRSKGQATLKSEQRALLGLPPLPPPKPDPTRTTPAALATPPAAALLTPSQHRSPLVAVHGRAYTDALTPASLLNSAATTRSSMATSPSHRQTPYSGARVVATPRELRPFLDALSQQGASPLASTPERGGVGGVGGWGGLGYDAAGGSAGGGYPPYQDQQQADGAGALLPLGRNAPTYRPTLVPRKAASTTGAEAAQPSADQEMQAMLAEVLGMGQADGDSDDEGAGPAEGMGSPPVAGERSRSGWALLRTYVRAGSAAGRRPPQRAQRAARREPLADLQVWTERLREWMAQRMLQPLAALMGGAAEDANALLRALGAGGAQQLPTLAAAVGLGADDGGGGGGGAAAMADAEGLVQQLLRQLASLAPAQQEQLRPLAVALHRYDQLLALLKGRRPAELLPPAPPGYVASRVQSLSRGTCMRAYEWNGGGEWQGRPWTEDLPTDAAILFYLFAAFMDAPGWEFPLQPAGEARHTPLYLGQVRARPPAQYSALLAYRPDKPGPGVAAVVGSGLASRAPHFTLLAEGRAAALSGRPALFQALLLFLQYHAAKRHGLVGRAALGDDALRLDLVLEPGGAPATIPQRVYNWWYPPYRP